MSGRSAKSKSAPSSSSSTSSIHTANDSNPVWLNSFPWTLSDNHEDPDKDIWSTPWYEKHWDECRDMLKKHDTRVIGEWNDEINTQLLVSSLLAAVAGGFVVESQKSLSEDPATTTAVVLLQIARQLNESIGLPDTEFVAFGGPSGVERTFNSLFYASLGLSLANVTLGLLCLQWIRGMKNEPPGLRRHLYPELRFLRYTGFEHWGARAVISALPVVLLAALMSFFAGLLAFASDSDWIASIPLYLILLLVFAIVLFTTFIPGLVIVLNSAFRKGSEFPSIPPFRSLQSWIAMQGFIHIFQAVNRIFNLHPFGAFKSLRKCLDWGQLDQLWTRWSFPDSKDSNFFPLILSMGTMEDMNTISNIFEETIQRDVEPKFRKLSILKVLASYGQQLPATTISDISEHFIVELATLINIGTSLGDLSSAFDIDEKIALDFVSTGVILQLVNSLIFLCRAEKPSINGFWNLFWKTLGDSIQGVPFMPDPDTAPILFNDALDTIQIALEDPLIDTQVIFQRGFKSFIKVLAYELEHERVWARSERGSATLRTIVSHPIWIPARKVIAALPPGAHALAADKCLRTLDRIRQKRLPGTVPAPTLLEGVAGGKELPEREDDWLTSPPHLAIDMETKYEDDGTVPATTSPHALIESGPQEGQDTGETEDQTVSQKTPTTVASTPSSRSESAHLTTISPPLEV